MGRLAVASLALAGVLAPVRSPAQVAPPLVTPDQARDVLEEHEEINERNNDTLNVERQGMIEAPPLLTIDDAVFREFQGRGESTIGEDVDIDKRRVYPVESTTYPLQFLATERIQAEGFEDVRQVLLFVRPSEGEPWKTTLAAQLVDASLPKLSVDDDGFARLVDADYAASLRIKPESVAGALAGLWTQTLTDDSPENATFEEGVLTTGAVDLFVSELAASGIEAQGDFTFDAAEFPVAAFRMRGGGALVLCTIDMRFVLEPATSGGLFQPPSRDIFGGLVPPGTYAQVVYDALAIVAVVVPEGDDDRVEVIGIYDGITEANAS